MTQRQARESSSRFVLCGDPRFGWNGDTGFVVEKRQRWPVSGNMESTKEFARNLREAGNAVDANGKRNEKQHLYRNVIAVLAGHEHVHRVDKIRKSVMQYITVPGFEGGLRRVTVEDMRN